MRNSRLFHLFGLQNDKTDKLQEGEVINWWSHVKLKNPRKNVVQAFVQQSWKQLEEESV